MSLPTLSYYHVVYECCPPVLRGADQRELNAEEITESCELLLAAAHQHRCPYWLLDGRHHRREQPQTLHNWMREEYFPRVRGVLGQTPCVAFLVPPFVWAGLQAKGYNEPGDWHAHAVRLGWFTDEAPAREWLAGHQAHRAAPGRTAGRRRPNGSARGSAG